jgi:hypothetical protein
MKNLLIILLLVLPFALFSAAPRCLEGVEVSVIDANGKVIKTGKLNSQGSLTLDGITEAVWDIKLTNNGKSIVLGVNNTKKRIDKSTPLLFQSKISDYQDGDDLLLRKRPGRTHSKVGEGKTGSTRQRGSQGEAGLNETNNAERVDANHNSTRSNRSANALDVDSDDDGIDDDCDDATIEVSTSTGRGGGVKISIKTKM